MKICAKKPIALTTGDWDKHAKGTVDEDYTFTPKMVEDGTPLDLPVEKNQNCQEFIAGLMHEGLLIKYEGKKKVAEPVTKEDKHEK